MKKVFTGGDKLQAKLKELAKNLATAGSVEIGWTPQATYPDGQYVAQIAANNEFGSSQEVEPHEVTMYRKVGKNGDFLRGGKFVKRSQSNFSTTAMTKKYNIVIPPRPFIRTMIAAESPHWGDDVGLSLKLRDYDTSKALKLVGKQIAGEMQQSIRDFTDPPNAPSTIRKKGFNDPLIDTGHMRNTIKSVVQS